MNTNMQSRFDTKAGDWLEARGTLGKPARRGEIIEVLGEPGREHYRVRWDARHESIVYPADGVSVIPSERPEVSSP
jgi:hypothetical protein